MRKVVINVRFGGYSVSVAAARRMAEMGCEVAAHDLAEYDANMAAWRETGLNPQWAKYGASEFLLRREPDWYGYLYDVPRDDPILVQVVEELGERANGSHAELRVVEIPSDVEWEIDEYDGNETVEEAHRSWH